MPFLLEIPGEQSGKKCPSPYAFLQGMRAFAVDLFSHLHRRPLSHCGGEFGQDKQGKVFLLTKGVEPESHCQQINKELSHKVS